MNMKEIMKRAWEIKKEDSRNIFGLCLKMAWAEAKSNTKEEKIKKLEELGFKRWTVKSYDRLYINAYYLGLKTTKYRTGNISSARFNGESISNCEARRMLNSKSYIDVNTMEMHSEHRDLFNSMKNLVTGIL